MRKKTIYILLLIVLGVFIFSVATTFAFDGNGGNEGYSGEDGGASGETLYWLHQDGLDSNTVLGLSFFSGIFRSIGFGFIKLLAKCVDVFSNGLSVVINFMGFLHDSPLTNYIESYNPVFKMLFGLAVLFLGLHMFLKPQDKDGNIIQNVLICIVIIVALPAISSKLVNLTSEASNAALAEINEDSVIEGASGETTSPMAALSTTGSNRQKNVGSLADSIIRDNVVDLTHVDEKWGAENKTPWRINGKPAGFMKDGAHWYEIDINQLMNKNYDNGVIWENALTDTGNPDSSLTSLRVAVFESLSICYYRYQVISWWSIIIELLLVAVILVFTTFKVALLLFNIAQTLIFTPFIAVTDLATGQRIKETLKGLISLFAAIYLAIVLMGLFFIGYRYISSEVDEFLIRVVLIIALTAAVINGPDLIERIIGVDVGVKSGFRTALAAYGVGKAVAGTASKIGKGAKKVGSGALNYAKANKTKDGSGNNVPFDKKPSNNLASVAERERTKGALNQSSADTTSPHQKGNNSTEKGSVITASGGDASSPTDINSGGVDKEPIYNSETRDSGSTAYHSSAAGSSDYSLRDGSGGSSMTEERGRNLGEEYDFSKYDTPSGSRGNEKKEMSEKPVEAKKDYFRSQDLDKMRHEKNLAKYDLVNRDLQKGSSKDFSSSKRTPKQGVRAGGSRFTVPSSNRGSRENARGNIEMNKQTNNSERNPFKTGGKK